MSEAKHTPGPWRYGFPTARTPHGVIKHEDWGCIRDSQGSMIARASVPWDEEVLNQHRRDGTDPTAAVSRLISAAPEMADALERLVSFCEEFDWLLSEFGDEPHGDVNIIGMLSEPPIDAEHRKLGASLLEALPEDLRRAKAALAKARGRE